MEAEATRSPGARGWPGLDGYSKVCTVLAPKCASGAFRGTNFRCRGFMLPASKQVPYPTVSSATRRPTCPVQLELALADSMHELETCQGHRVRAIGLEAQPRSATRAHDKEGHTFDGPARARDHAPASQAGDDG